MRSKPGIADHPMLIVLPIAVYANARLAAVKHGVLGDDRFLGLEALRS